MSTATLADRALLSVAPEPSLSQARETEWVEKVRHLAHEGLGFIDRREESWKTANSLESILSLLPPVSGHKTEGKDA